MDAEKPDNIGERERDIERIFRRQMGKPQVGIRLDILRGIMDDIDSNSSLNAIFGPHVTSKLGIIAEVNDLKIVDAKIVELKKEQEAEFLKELSGILKRNAEDSRL